MITLEPSCGPYPPPGAEVAHSAAQVSLLFPTRRRRCHFHAQSPRHLHSKCTSARLCANESVGLKKSCCWDIVGALLSGAPENVCAIDHQKPRLKSGTVLSCNLQNAVFGCVHTGAHILLVTHVNAQQDSSQSVQLIAVCSDTFAFLVS